MTAIFADTAGMWGARLQIAVVVLLPALLCTPTNAGTLAHRYFLSDLSGGAGLKPAAWAQSINASGQVALNETTTGGGNSSVWTPSMPNQVDGSRFILPTPTIPATPPGPFGGGSPAHPAGSLVVGMNDFGQIVGATYDSAGVIWTPSIANGSTLQMTLVKPIANSMSTIAHAVNSRGDFVVGANLTNFLYATGTPNVPSTTPVALPAEFNVNNARTLNDRGEIGIYANATLGRFFRPSQPNGTAGTVFNSPGILDLNNTDLAVGSGGVFRVSTDAVPTFTSLAAGSFNAVSENEIAVGNGGNAWSAADGVVDLDTRLESHSGAQWTIASLSDVNPSGQMVGIGLLDTDNNPATQGVSRAILLTPLIDGDATIDQHVDFADLVVLAQHYNQSAGQTWRTGDFDGNSTVDFNDLVVLAQHYNTGGVTDAGFAADWALAQSLVPEPAALSLAATAMAIRRRRR